MHRWAILSESQLGPRKFRCITHFMHRYRMHFDVVYCTRKAACIGWTLAWRSASISLTMYKHTTINLYSLFSGNAINFQWHWPMHSWTTDPKGKPFCTSSSILLVHPLGTQFVQPLRGAISKFREIDSQITSRFWCEGLSSSTQCQTYRARW